MTPATPYTMCANGCGIPAKWKKRGKNLCNSCTLKIRKPQTVKRQDTRFEAEVRRKREVLDRVL